MRTCGTLGRTSVALQRTGSAPDRAGGAKDRTGVALQRTGGALDRTGVALQRAGDPTDRTGGAIERSRHVLTLEPAAAHTAGPPIFGASQAPPSAWHPRDGGCVRHADTKVTLHLAELSP